MSKGFIITLSIIIIIFVGAISYIKYTKYRYISSTVSATEYLDTAAVNIQISLPEKDEELPAVKSIRRANDSEFYSDEGRSL